MMGYRTAVSRLRHPVNIALHTNAPLGVRIANSVTGFMGSWKFIVSDGPVGDPRRDLLYR
jgi:uncharacterized membrane protein